MMFVEDGVRQCSERRRLNSATGADVKADVNVTELGRFEAAACDKIFSISEVASEGDRQ